MASSGRRTSFGALNSRARTCSNRLNRFSIRRTTARPLWASTPHRFPTSPRHPHQTGVLTGRRSCKGWSSGTTTSTLMVSTSSTTRPAWTRCLPLRRGEQGVADLQVGPATMSWHQTHRRPSSTTPMSPIHPWPTPRFRDLSVPAEPAIVRHNAPTVPSSILLANHLRAVAGLAVRGPGARR